ncbi:MULTISPECIES: sigma E protease regulator RseP [unclassified Vibrio]|uniref:sigma E protease regulator RseP n=3 Tax=Vibrio TaxID=662 RepID=UPI001372B276|nr:MULTISPECIES: sigma E protease regulator RseP [unclassified Vibrio]NAW68557.1 sigma E protease regulator RseP [Vibrio sp. V28_P6S34P95]NAX06582.1 sigma E protease regulator RseP [Vibrio sp. V30_P3S12P165]NAX33423.1 sigma E protease regulator RseP [Vibrio sp. V29_P1S30P107]NAX37272.1 sigma E protease regulator RseP [Vibrio sp. V27_P1S3P104]NAX40044.1 sigma E protease regulator RseP [Vibrio sp. V26_P1S5P106]
MSGILWNFIAFVVALGILVAVHEYGHFWVARKCGVKVEKFSIGFGRAIWKRMGKDGTEYSLSIIPLGGYVKMLDSRVADVPVEMQPFAFDKKSLWQRSAIVSAGPIFNFLFALVAYWLVFLIGVPAVKPVIGEVTPYSIAAQAGVEPGMEIKAVSGSKTLDWESVNMGLIRHIGNDQLTLTVSSPDRIGIDEIKTFDLRSWNFDPETESAMGALGFKPFMPAVSTVLASISSGSAGERAGLQVGDVLTRINGQPIANWQQAVADIQASPDKALTLAVERDQNMILLSLTPDSRTLKSGEVIGFAGIAPQVEAWPEGYRFELQFGVLESIDRAFDKTGQVIELTLSLLKKLLVGDVGLNNLSGPISIAKGAGTTADYGLVYFLGFLALISINLGIINLVPLPMLDGGHLLFFAIEAVIRRPVPEKVQEIGYRLGGVIIFSLMALAIFNDFTRL